MGERGKADRWRTGGIVTFAIFYPFIFVYLIVSSPSLQQHLGVAAQYGLFVMLLEFCAVLYGLPLASLWLLPSSRKHHLLATAVYVFYMVLISIPIGIALSCSLQGRCL